MNDFISKKALINITDRETVTTNPDNFTANEKFNYYIDDHDISSFGKWMFNNGYNTALVTVRMEADKLPIADVAPVVHSKWVGAPGYWHCPECGAEPIEISPYCPGCGAIMDEREDNDSE